MNTQVQDNLKHLSSLIASMKEDNEKNKLKLLKAEHSEEEMIECMESMKKNMMNMMESVYSTINSIYGELDSVYGNFAKHQTGHMPPLTAGQLNKIIKVAGAGDDYEVVKKYIYAKNGNLEVNLTAKQ